ncbi:NADPH-dependent FMN reductase [Hyphomonas neptunium ATCC 15444]|uniref:NADPH-dependent FMN reductase n=2 Tax=Hyphomonas TaxID=85 RepID=Q0BZG0_HYPNA|nr:MULTISPECIES: NADPH-dependent FMN reductase [Hyphomonas]ABI77199.1 NADPH-dependent FMN reductase [Hyphomonas neptunium ATCC 15444]KCZ95222.1 NADPH-dependent FMN reductase [Hyphomonas hirschiana VP5]
MTRILGLSGSLRKASFNTGLLRASEALMPEGAHLDAHTLHGVPLFDADAEAEQGVPPAVAVLKEALAESEGLLLVTPEYNNGIPGVFKNAIDWMSRPPGGTDLFKGKPVAVIGASPGGFGTMLSQAHWLPVLRTLGTRHWSEGRLMVSRAGNLFDAEGRLTDDETRKRLADFLSGFVSFVQAG